MFSDENILSMYEFLKPSNVEKTAECFGLSEAGQEKVRFFVQKIGMYNLKLAFENLNFQQSLFLQTAILNLSKSACEFGQPCPEPKDPIDRLIDQDAVPDNFGGGTLVEQRPRLDPSFLDYSSKVTIDIKDHNTYFFLTQNHVTTISNLKIYCAKR